MEYRVVRISNNLEEYPDCVKDTEEFPQLIEHVEDEMDLFIVAENGQFWPADEFFSMGVIDKFREL